MLEIYSRYRISLLERLRFPFTPIGRREFLARDQVFPIFSVYSLYFCTKICIFTPVLTIGIVRDCLYLLIFYSGKISTWVWSLPFVVNLNHNLSIIFFFTNNCNVEGHYKNYPTVVMFPPSLNKISCLILVPVVVVLLLLPLLLWCRSLTHWGSSWGGGGAAPAPPISLGQKLKPLGLSKTIFSTGPFPYLQIWVRHCAAYMHRIEKPSPLSGLPQYCSFLGLGKFTPMTMTFVYKKEGPALNK